MSEPIKIMDKRFYPYEDKWVPSVTTILSVVAKQGLEQWRGNLGNEEADRVRDEAADSGTRVHDYCERLAKGEMIDLTGLPAREAKKVNAFFDFLNDLSVEIVAVEQKVYFELPVDEEGDEVEMYAGTLDLVIRTAEGNFVVDIKTGSSVHKTHELQIAAYREAWNDMGHEQIEGGAILHLNDTKRGYTFKVIENMDAAASAFFSTWELWKYMNPNAAPKNWEGASVLQYAPVKT